MASRASETEGRAAPSPGTGTRSIAERLQDGGARYGVVIFLALLTAGFSVALPSEFPTSANFKAMVNGQAVLLLLALAATIPLRGGDFDLSISSMMTATAAVAAILLNHGTSLVLVLLLTVAMGVVVGLINGLLIVKLGTDSFITTLGVLTALTGFTYAVTNSQVIFGVNGGVLSFAQRTILGLPLQTWYGWALLAVAWYVFERTPAGRYLVFVGGSRDVARLAGVPVDRVRIGSFVASAVVAGFAGVVLVGNLGTLDPSIGPGYLLQPFAAAFLGATTIHIGRFNAIGTTVGLYLLTVGITGLQLLGAATWVSNVFNGLALVAAVALARLAARRSPA